MPKGLTTEHIDLLWLRMAKIYGHKWTSSYGESDDGTWLSALRCVTTEKVKHGLELCLARNDPWPPSLPEFIQMCLDIPDIETVTSQILSGRPTGTLSAMIAKQIGSWDLRNSTASELRKRVRTLYEIAYSESIAKTMTPETNKKITGKKHEE